MSFSDIIKKSVLETMMAADMTPKYIMLVFFETFLIAAYIFFFYRIMTRTSFYNKGYALSMAMISVVTAGIILAMQSNLVISLGMVGALSIVRFRTAIKEPLDLLFLFWSIGVGIVTGAGLFYLAILMSFSITVGLGILNMIPLISTPELLIIKTDIETEAKAMELVRTDTSVCRVDSKSVADELVTLLIEIRAKNGGELVNKLASLPGVKYVNLMKHDGEVKS